MGGQTEQEPGCTPYIEYVLYFVLQRALGTKRAGDRLPFRTAVESARLVSRALSVIEAVLLQYAVPSLAANGNRIFDFAQELKEQGKIQANASLVFRMAEFTRKLFCTPTENDMKLFARDFQSKLSSAPDQARSAMPLPRVLTPGYVILADLLSGTESSLFKVLSMILVQDYGRDGINEVYRKTHF